MKNTRTIAIVAIAVVIVASIGFVVITRTSATTTNSLSCEGARTEVVFMPSAIIQNHTAYQTEITSTFILPSTTFTTTTNFSSSIGRVVTSTTTLGTATSGHLLDWIAVTCTYVR